MNQRVDRRLSDVGFQFPISFRLRDGRSGESHPLETVNYHYRGACLKLAAKVDPFAVGSGSEPFVLELYVGKQRINDRLGFRVCWNTVARDGCFGVEFRDPIRAAVMRKERVRSNLEYSPTLTCADPLDPNRTVLFKVRDISETGMLLATSLNNKHLLPGMKLEKCSLSIPGQTDASQVSLRIENTRPGDGSGRFGVGASILEMDRETLASLQTYLTLFAPAEPRDGDRLAMLSKAGHVGKRIKGGITFRVIDTQEEYEELLKLRYCGYGKHGKVRVGSRPEDQGEGLANEGTLVCGFIGGQMVSSMELRFPREARELRMSALFGQGELLPLFSSSLVEINKLVVRPEAQGSDIVLGMFQKAHALLVARGGCDVLICATDQLVPLYERIGFAKCGVSAPHPTLSGVRLHAMLLRKEAYLRGEGLNPYLWSVVFEATQKHFEELGLSARHRLGVWKRIQRALTERLLSARRRKASRRGGGVGKPAAGGQAGQGAAPAGNAPAIDLRWTAQHMLAGVVYPYILEADRMVGRNRVDGLLSELKVPREYLARPGNWVSVAFLDAFTDLFGHHGNVAELSRRSGIRSLQPDVLGLKHYVLKHFLTPQQAFQAFEKILPKMNATRVPKLHECRNGLARISVGVRSRELLPKHPESCLNWEENFKTYIRIMTGQEGTVRKLSCCYQGAETCTYEVRWRKQYPYKLWLAAATLAGASGVGAFIPLQHRVGPASASFGVAAALESLVLGVLALRLRGLLTERLRYNAEFEEFEQAANERYSQLELTKNELDRRYKELRLLGETSEAIIRNNELSAILRETLDSICKKFSFGRAFAMLANESRTTLNTASIAGIEGSSELLWKFSVDVRAKRDNALVLSSVYHTGRSVVINDVETHLGNLNEASRQLIRTIGVKCFAIVAIPSEQWNWGVLVIDKGEGRGVISPDDAALLERVAYNLGIALDKQARLESERRDRALFEKFVPAYAKKDLLTLGAETRDTIAMFVDLQGYTALSESLSPAGVATLVNGFYSLVHDCARKRGGYTDKYIGDAALVTWGYLDALAPDSVAAVECALSIVEGLEGLNERLAAEGIPPVSLRIGVHRGLAVCGLFGCEDRMEFTGIGPTINAASRLQAFCKEQGAVIAVSGRILETVPATLASRFNVSELIQLRGVREPVRVGWIPKPKNDARTGRERKAV